MLRGTTGRRNVGCVHCSFIESLGMQASSSGVCYRDETGEIAVDHRQESKGGLSASQVENASQNWGLTQTGRGGGKAGLTATRVRGALPECR